MIVYIVFVVLLPAFLTTQKTPSFKIERRETLPDTLIDPRDVNKDENSFVKDGSCIQSDKTIASRYSDNELKCFSDLKLQTLGNELCKDGLQTVTESESKLTFCQLTEILTVAIWSLKEWKDLSVHWQSELFISRRSMVIKARRKWNGLLARAFVRCGNNQEVKCVTLKFTGVRSHPLPTDVGAILRQPPTITPTKDNDKQSSSSSSDDSSNTGMVVGVVLACVLIVALTVAVGFFYMKRRKRMKEIRKRRDPSVYASTTVDIKYKKPKDQSGDDCETVTMLPASEYASPSDVKPVYHELVPMYNDGSDRLRPVQRNTGSDDTPNQTTEEWPPVGYKVPSTAVNQDVYDTPIGDSHDEDDTNDKSHLYAKVNKEKKEIRDEHT